MNAGRFVLPALLVLAGGVSASAQVRIGVDFGPVRVLIAPDAPPPPRWERRSVRPSQGFIWIDGYWDRRDDRWAWAPGRWEEPAQEDSRWIAPRYRREGEAYRYEPGRWSHQQMVEGEDYSRWHREHGEGRGHGRWHEGGRGHGHDRGHGRGGHDEDRGEGHGDRGEDRGNR